MRIREVKDLQSMLCYFGENLNWSIDTDDFEVSDYTYEVYSDDLGIKEEEFAKISSLYQMRPFTDSMPFGVFAVTFESKRLEVAALKKSFQGSLQRKRIIPTTLHGTFMTLFSFASGARTATVILVLPALMIMIKNSLS